MSIYDNLANSDFVDKGQFKKQLQELGHYTLPEDDEPAGIQDNYGDDKNSSHEFNQEKMSKETKKRQKMDERQEPEVGLFKPNDSDMRKQLKFLKRKTEA